MSSLPDKEIPLWRSWYPKKPVYPELSEDVEADVAIVGAGITGLTAAYLLKEAGFRVAVLEKYTVGAGTTGRTTGKITSQHNIFYDDLIKRVGIEKAKLYGQANQSAIGRVELIVRSIGIECDWQRTDNYVFTADYNQVGKFKQEAEAAQRLGLPATFETDTPLPFEVKAAVRFANQATFNSQKYVLGLADAINGGGSYVFENSNAIFGIREGKPGHVRTAKAKVMARDIIVTTNVPTMPLIARGAYAVHQYPSESYLVAGYLKSKLTGMYISPDDDHYSIHPVTLDGKPMLLIGGEGHFFGLRGNRQARFRRLADYAAKHFDIQQIENKWSDRDYLAYDKIPLVGKLYPWSEHIFVGTAFKKWGLTNGTAAAMILSDMIQNNRNEWLDVFNSQRVTFKNL